MTRLTYLFVLTATFSFAAYNTSQKEKSNEQKGVKTADKTPALSQKNEKSLSELVFTDADGNSVTLSSLKGKVVFINFWATWCPPCVAEMPTISDLKKKFVNNENIVFLMVDVDGKLEKSKAFMENKNYDLKVYSANRQTLNAFLNGSIPTTIILDKKGEVAARVEGSMDYTSTEVMDALNKMVEE